MKRLIRKSELYDSFKDDQYENDYYEVFINPTRKEINDTFINSMYDSIRGVS